MIKDKKLFLFDIDGTLALGDDIFDGTADLIDHIKKINGRAMFISNNVTKSRVDYVRKFKNWSIKTEIEDFITASFATALYLTETYGSRLIFAVAPPPLLRELRGYGLNLTEKNEKNIEAVLVSFDTGLTYEKLYDASFILQTTGADFVATNPDLRCPAPFGFIPDCGAICDMLTATTDKTPYYIGKPKPKLVELCLKHSGFSAAEAVVVGDRLYTDVAVGINAGIDSCLLFSGETKPGDLENTEFMPTYTFEDVRELCRHLDIPDTKII
ncbi:MAG: HAD-IIA family hydrolase [Oscillospiraceae bacterium]|nr:HAD-IIA family hydrolase [Oscillospiraceae bacterium]